MINGLCLEGLFDEIAIKKIKDNGCIPNAIFYQTFIHALFENAIAKKLLHEMIARDLP